MMNVRGSNFDMEIDGDEYMDDVGGEYGDMGGEYMDDGGEEGGEYVDQGGEYMGQGGEYGDMGGEYVEEGGEYVDQGGEYMGQGGEYGDMGGDMGGEYMGGEYMDQGGEYMDQGGEYMDQGGDMGGEYMDQGGGGGEYMDQGDVSDQAYIDQAYVDDGFQGGYQENVFDDGPVLPPPPPPLSSEKLATVISYEVIPAKPVPAGTMPMMGGASGLYTIRYDDGSGTDTIPSTPSMGPSNPGAAAFMAGINGKIYVTFGAAGNLVSTRVASVAPVAAKGPPVAPPRSQPVVEKPPPVAPPRSQPAPVVKGPPVAPPRSQPVVGKGPPVAPPRSKPAAVPAPPGTAVTVVGKVVDGNASGSISSLNVPAWYMIKYPFGGKDRTYKHNIIVKKPADRLANGASMKLTINDRTGNVLAVGEVPTGNSKAGAIAVDNTRAAVKMTQGALADSRAKALRSMPGPVAASVTPAAREAALRVAAALTKK